MPLWDTKKRSINPREKRIEILNKPESLSLTSLLNKPSLLIILFISFRLTVLLMQQPVMGGFIPDVPVEQFRINLEGKNFREQGVTLLGDYWYYVGVMQYNLEGKLPYRDYWYEFPPVFAGLSTILFHFSIVPSNISLTFSVFSGLLALVMIVVDTLNLLMLRRIGTHLHSPASGMGIAWVYALLPMPYLNLFWNFEPLVAFTVLLSLDLLIRGRNLSGAFSIVLGTCTKFFPLILLGAVWKIQRMQDALKITLAVGLLVGIVFGSMIALNREFGVASLAVQFNKASYDTVWAVLDGNHRQGLLDPNRTDPQAAYRLQGNPAVIPWWLRALVFGGVGFYVFVKTRRKDALGFVAFTLMTIIIFFLWSQGWSPQWQVTLTPLILLCFPDFFGITFCISFALINLAIHPFISFQVSPITGQYPPNIVPLWTLLVIFRTLFLVWLALKIYPILRMKRDWKVRENPLKAESSAAGTVDLR